MSGSIVQADVVTPGGERIAREIRVEPPSVRTALGVLASLQADDRAYFARTVKSWLPEDLFRAYFESGYPVEKAIRQIVDMLSVGHGSKEEYERDKAEVEKERSWHSVIADYRDAFKCDPLEETWSYFLAQYAELMRLRKVRQLEAAEGYRLGQSGDRDTFRQLRFAAYPELRDQMGEDVSDEFRDEEIRKIKERRALQKMQGRGQA